MFFSNFSKYQPITIVEGREKRIFMLAPDIIEKIRREKEERERPALRLPLHEPEMGYSKESEEEKSSNIIVIELA